MHDYGSIESNTYRQGWLEYSTIMSGATLELELGPQPNRNWGSDGVE